MKNEHMDAAPNVPQAKKSNLVFKIVVLIVLCITAVAIVYIAMNLNKDPAAEKAKRDDEALAGQLEGKNQAETEAILNKVVEDGMFNISINSETVFENGKSKGRLAIENVPTNKFLMQVTITLDETGEEVYRSGMIEPGFYIEETKLKKDLDKGDYVATALFTAYDKESETIVGSTAASIKLIVKS